MRILDQLKPINTRKKVDQIMKTLHSCTMEAHEARVIYLAIIHEIRSVRVQCYFKDCFKELADHELLRSEGQSLSSDKPGAPSDSRRDKHVSRESLIHMFVGQKLAKMAVYAQCDVQELVDVLKEHGHGVCGKNTRVIASMVPCFRQLLPDSLPHPKHFAAVLKLRQSKAKIGSKPLFDGSSISRAYGQEGDYRRLLYNRSRY